MQNEYLMHFNPFHDPRNGRFASGGSSGRSSARSKKQADKKRKYEEQKQNAIKSGSAKDVLKFRGNLTNNELQQAVNRINMEQRLESVVSEKRRKKGKSIAGKVIGAFGQATLTAVSTYVGSLAVQKIKTAIEKKEEK